MQPDLLQQLRDIHVPAEPTWWPPAPGWWIIAALLLGAAVWGALQLLRAYRNAAPTRRARVLLRELYDAYDAGRVSPDEYAHGCNALLKRLFVHGLGVDAARPVSDAQWLAMLDRCAGETAFSCGPGQALGNERFRRQGTIDVPALHALVARLLEQRRLAARARQLATGAEVRNAGQHGTRPR
jgi:hypothetical protein